MIEAVEYLAQLIREQYPDAILERIRSQELDARRGVKIIYYHQSGPASGAAAPRTPGTGQYTAVVPCTLIGVAADDMGVEDADLDLALYMQSLTDWLLQLRPVYPTNPALIDQRPHAQDTLRISGYSPSSDRDSRSGESQSQRGAAGL